MLLKFRKSRRVISLSQSRVKNESLFSGGSRPGPSLPRSQSDFPKTRFYFMQINYRIPNTSLQNRIKMNHITGLSTRDCHYIQENMETLSSSITSVLFALQGKANVASHSEKIYFHKRNSFKIENILYMP